MSELYYSSDLAIIVLYIIFNWVLMRKDKGKLRIWYEGTIRGFIPGGIAFFVWYFMGSWLIWLLIPIGLIFIYVVNNSEWFLFTTYTNMGRKLLVLNFFEEEPVDNKLNVYIDSAQKPINISQQIENNIRKQSSEELEKYKAIIESFEFFNLRVLRVNLCDMLKKGPDDYEFVHYVLIYYINQNMDKELIPKVLNLNCCVLEPEIIKEKKYWVILGIEGVRDDELLTTLERFKYIFENVKMLPKFMQYEMLKDELNAKNITIEMIRTQLKKTTDDKNIIKTEIDTYQGKK